MDERTTVIIIDGKAYDIVCSTRVTKALLEKYGSIEALAEKAKSIGTLSENIEEILWLIELFVNESITIHNIRHRESPLSLITSEELEILTTPGEYPGFWNAVWTAIGLGMQRNVQSEEDPSKNSQVG